MTLALEGAGKMAGIGEDTGALQRGLGYRDKDPRATEVGRARDIYEKDDYVGRAQMNRGLSRASQAGLGASTGRGSSALNRRNAMYGTAGAQSGVAMKGSQAVVAERGARNQAYLSALDRQAQYVQGDRDDRTRMYLGELEAEAPRSSPQGATCGNAAQPGPLWAPRPPTS